MHNRIVHKDKIGIHVMEKRRKYRPPTNTAISAKEKVYVHTYSAGQRAGDDRIYVTRFAEREYEITKDSMGREYRRAKPLVQEVEELWTTTDAFPQITERLKDGQSNIIVQCNGTKQTVVVGADGFNYRNYRKEPGAYQKKTLGMNILLGDLLLNWQEWDDLVAKVNDAREQVQIGPITEKLKAELEEHDCVQNYLREKGLIGTEATDHE